METIEILKNSFDNRGKPKKREKSIVSRKSSKGSKKSVTKRKPSLLHNLSSVQDLRYKHMDSIKSNKSLKSGSNCVLLADGSMS